MTGWRGEDSIYWHAKKGCYVGVVSLGYSAAGKRRRRTVMAKTKAAVQDKLKALHRELDGGTQTSPAYTVELESRELCSPGPFMSLRVTTYAPALPSG